MRFHKIKQYRSQLVFVLAGIAIAGIVTGVTGMLLATIEEQLQDDVTQEVVVLTDQAASNASDHILMTEQAIEAFTVQSADIEEIQPALLNFKESFSFAEVAYLGIDGLGCRANGVPFTAEEGSTTEVVSERKGVSYYASHLSSQGTFVYQATKPLSIDGEIIGTLYVGIPIDMMISRQEFRIFDGEGFFILLEGDTGKVIMNADEDEAALNEGGSLYNYLDLAQHNDDLLTATADTFEENPVRQLEQAVKNGETVLVTTSIYGETTYVGVAPVGSGNYYMCGFVPEESVRSEVSSINTIFAIVFVIIFFCLLAVLAMFLFFYRKKMEERGIELKNHLYSALSDSLEMAVNMYSPEDSTVTPIVAKVREIIGYSMVEFMGNRRVADKIDLSESGRDMLARLRDGNVTSTERGEFSVRNRQTGELRWVTYSVTPLLFENKRQLLVVFRDSTNEKNLQLSMREAMVAAETANHAKSDFLSRMSHEIRTPMTAIIGMTQIAQKHSDDEERIRESLDKIILTSDHLLSLINDVLDISKIESGKMMLVRQSFIFSDLLNQVETVINAQCDLKGQDFIVERGEILEEHFMGDQVRLKQVLLNLLSNSVKYTPSKGKVILRVYQEWSATRGYVRATAIVSDDGIGMSKDFQKHLFEPFAMEERLRSQGTGLGMPIVRNILTMMNGDIQVVSEIDEGTSFTVVVNLEIAREKKSGKEGPAIQHSAIQYDENGFSIDAQGQDMQIETVETSEELCLIELGNVRVLLAEDNDLSAEIAEELLIDSGLKVEHARDGDEACEMFAGSEPGYFDIILMDIQMPHMSGYEATKCIRELDREDAKTIPIIAMSANAFMEDVQASIRCGMNAHLSKPINIRNVLEVISEQIKKQD